MERLLLIDGNSIAYRAFYGSFNPHRPVMSSPNGTPTNAIHTFGTMLLKVIKENKPTHIFIAFDAGKKTVRHQSLESYKAGRKSMPQELVIQMPLLKTLVDKMGITRREYDLIEADDIIGTMATKCSKKAEVFIYSSDKDLYQLVAKNVSVLAPQNGQKPNNLIEINNFEETFGYMPNQVPDIKGLVGDSSDNLPGVKGLGPKGAIKLIQQYKTLEGVYRNVFEVKGAVQQKLLDGEEVARLCKDLATLDKDVEMLDDLELEDLAIAGVWNHDVSEFLDKFNLKTLKRRFEEEVSDEKLEYKNLNFS